WSGECELSPGAGLARSLDGSCCSWDGRLDNRKDLLLQNTLSKDWPDSSLVLSLYGVKGVDGLKDVVGDWSLCIWDRQRRTIVLASDFAGIRPLFYYSDGEFLCWSSDLSDVLHWSGSAKLDETYVATFLARGSVPERTPYRDVFIVM